MGGIGWLFNKGLSGQGSDWLFINKLTKKADALEANINCKNGMEVGFIGDLESY